MKPVYMHPMAVANYMSSPASTSTEYMHVCQHMELFFNDPKDWNGTPTCSLQQRTRFQISNAQMTLPSTLNHANTLENTACPLCEPEFFKSKDIWQLHCGITVTGLNKRAGQKVSQNFPTSTHTSYVHPSWPSRETNTSSIRTVLLAHCYL